MFDVTSVLRKGLRGVQNVLILHSGSQISWYSLQLSGEFKVGRRCPAPTVNGRVQECFVFFLTKEYKANLLSFFRLPLNLAQKLFQSPTKKQAIPCFIRCKGILIAVCTLGQHNLHTSSGNINLKVRIPSSHVFFFFLFRINLRRIQINPRNCS
jgi:hypothetical protein